MTDNEQTTDGVTDNNSDTTAKVATKKARKKATVKTTAKATDTVEAKVVEETADSSGAGKEDKRARLASKLQAMGMMPGSAAKAASDKVAKATSSTAAKVSSGISGLDLTLPKWLSPQLLAVTAGAGIFAVLIWSLEQDKKAGSQLVNQPVAPVYNPYNPYATTPPVMPHPAPPVQALNQPDPAGQNWEQGMNQPPYPMPPGYQPYDPAYPPQTGTSAADKIDPAGQGTQQAYQNSRPPSQAGYQNGYGYGYEYHPAMRFGFNGRMQGQGQGYGRGNGANSYYYGPPPAYGYVPYGDPRGYGNPPPAAQQR